MYAYPQPPLPPSESATLAEAADYVRKLVAYVGMGFHPDTPFDEYVWPDRTRCFDTESVRVLELGLSRAWSVLDAARIELYDVAYSAQQELLVKA